MHRSQVQRVLSCAVAGLLLGGSARATPLFDARFTTDAPGSVPDGSPALPGAVSPKPTAVTASGGCSVLVQNTYTDTLTGNVFGSGNVAVFSDPDGGTTFMGFQGDVADSQSTGVFTVSWDWMEDKGVTPSTSSFFIGVTNQSGSENLSSIFLDLGEDSGNIRSANDVNFGATLGTAARGVPHHMDWVVDLDQADYSIATTLYLDGTLMHTQQREPLGVHEGASSFGRFKINSASSATGKLAFDNIMVQAGNTLVPGWTAASGDWNVASNWRGGVPNAVGAEALFMQSGASTQTVYTNTSVTIGSLRFDTGNNYIIAGAGPLTIQTSTGSGTVQVLSGSQKINLPLVFASSANVTVAAGATLTIGNPTTIKANKTVTKSGSVIIEAPLTLETGASLVSGAGAMTVFGAPSIGSNAQITLGGSALTVDYRGQFSPAGSIKGQLQSGYAGGAWNGSGINTSAAVAGQLGLGWVDDSGNQSIQVKLARYGDANLNGTVESTDFNAFLAGYGNNVDGLWGSGDFNYDDKVNTSDFNLLAGNFGHAAPGEPVLGSVVPEPAGTAALLVLLPTLRRTRRTS